MQAIINKGMTFRPFRPFLRLRLQQTLTKNVVCEFLVAIPGTGKP